MTNIVQKLENLIPNQNIQQLTKQTTQQLGNQVGQIVKKIFQSNQQTNHNRKLLLVGCSLIIIYLVYLVLVNFS